MRRGDRPLPDITSLSDLDTASLRRRWAGLFEIEAASRISRDLLIRAIAWRLQEEVSGGLSNSARRQLARHAAEFRASGSLSPSPSSNFKPVTRLIR
jgi:hypothetical protein